jgi:O-antigen ligase
MVWLAAMFARPLLLALIFSLAFMQPAIGLFGFHAVATDLLYLLLVVAWLVHLALRRVKPVWHPGAWLLVAYFAAMALSLPGADDAGRALLKLLTQLYLLSLPLLVLSLVRDERDMRRALSWWLGGTAVMVSLGILALVVLLVDPANPWFAWSRFHFGTLPPGEYPRLRLTHLNANMACNYLVASFLLLCAARWCGWISPRNFGLLCTGIVVAALATVSLGLGGLALAIGTWLWLLERRALVGRLALVAGIAAASVAIVAAAVTPILHSTAPFLIDPPLLDAPLAPSARLMIWLDAARNFAAQPWFGRGLGSDAVLVLYADPSGRLQRLTDAHNVYLSIAVQCGLVGLAALVALIVYAWRRTAPFRLVDSSSAVRLALGLAFLNGLAYQGFAGSFEDARHLWLLFGLLLASLRIEREGRLPAPG